MDNLFIQPTLTYKPILYPWLSEITDTHESMHWHQGEVELSPDVKDWKSRLTDIEKANIQSILQLFTQSDVEVGKFYYEKLIPYYRNNTIRNMFGSFVAREGIHQRGYALLNDTIGLPESDYQAFLEYEQMTDKVAFMQDGDCFDPESSALCKVRSILNEGVSLFASFCMLLNYGRTGRMTGMRTIVEWSIRDETIHVTGLTDLQKMEFDYFREQGLDLKTKIHDQVIGMCHEVYELESKFIDLAYAAGELPGLKIQDVKDFIKYIINLRIQDLGYELPYPDYSINSLPWMAVFINHEDLSNFFEKRVTQYSKTPLTGEWFPEKEVTLVS